MKKINWNTIRIIVMFLIIIGLYLFAYQKNNNRNIKAVEIDFMGATHNFIKTETVNKLLIENSNTMKSITKDALDLNKLEETVAKHPMIAKSDVYVTVDGVLRANVYQKTPVARVFSEESSFYIDSTGSKMPLSQNYTARVPLLYGKIKKEYAKPITKVLNCIEKDQFLKQNIIGVVVNPNQSLILRNRNFDYEIVFGGPIYIEKKFKNYKAFFQKAVEDSVLYHYKKVDLRFLKQVVCTK
ncbi:cell division protein FtsQ/DivIB [Flavobacterium croceum]|uniref:cell division protein FtsQ/DivIB n=1 Tax=Flavobacterium croceum TaxID=370975 RepID=UPI0024A92AC1|nr:cell division protein FtsQ [Flavobacterium croceum]